MKKKRDNLLNKDILASGLPSGRREYLVASFWPSFITNFLVINVSTPSKAAYMLLGPRSYRSTKLSSAKSIGNSNSTSEGKLLSKCLQFVLSETMAHGSFQERRAMKRNEHGIWPSSFLWHVRFRNSICCLFSSQ